MRGKAVRLDGGVWRDGRIHNSWSQRRRIPWKWSGDKHGTAKKPWAAETYRSQLLTSIEENADSAAQNRFPARHVMEYICHTEARRKVVPCSLPKWCALRRQRPSIGPGPLNRVRFQS